MRAAGYLLLAAIQLAIAGSLKRHASELLDSYDFVIAGGGTSGFTVADRLTEAFPESLLMLFAAPSENILVIEYGEVEYARGIFDPPMIVWGGASNWMLFSTPSPELNNSTALVIVGKVVGGSSAINGQFFDRAVEAQRRETRQKYNYTWDLSAFENTTPIHASLPPFLWGDHYVVRDAWKEMGIRVAEECANGNKEGLYWIPISQHPVTARRSYSGIGHYADVVDSRPNYHLLVKHQVARVLYPEGDTKSGPPTVEVRALDGSPLFNVSVKNEVILSAAVFGTPAILQRSGIGPAPFLRSAKIPLVLDLPGVGSNLHDHSGPVVIWNYTKSLPFYPLPSDMFNEMFAAEAAAAFNQTPAQGPYTLAMSNSASWVPLPNITVDYPVIANQIRALANSSDPSELRLPPAYDGDESLVEGYRAQIRQLADLYANPRSPSLESAVSTGNTAPAVLLHPLSRGTARLNLTHPFEPPVLDNRSASNPVDLAAHVAHTRYIRRTAGTRVLRELGAVEAEPGADVASSDEELEAFMRRSSYQSFMHPCCTAAMLPRELGGVVAPDLRVHGAEGSRVVDMSVMPLLPAAHLSATAYAVSEKAAHIIIKQWSN
ncbi:hypothetical protein VTG60DRAFT_811 [Thermothelomyces hinnuleus]